MVGLNSSNSSSSAGTILRDLTSVKQPDESFFQAGSQKGAAVSTDQRFLPSGVIGVLFLRHRVPLCCPPFALVPRCPAFALWSWVLAFAAKNAKFEHFNYFCYLGSIWRSIMQTRLSSAVGHFLIVCSCMTLVLFFDPGLIRLFACSCGYHFSQGDCPQYRVL